MHFNVVDLRGLPQAEVRPRIAGGSVAATAHHVGALLHAVCGQVDGGAHRVTRALRSSHELELQPVILVGRYIAQQHGVAIHHVDDNIQFAVVKQVANSEAAAGDDVGQARSRDGGHRLELLALDVVEEHRPLRPAGTPGMLVDLR